MTIIYHCPLTKIKHASTIKLDFEGIISKRLPLLELEPSDLKRLYHYYLGQPTQDNNHIALLLLAISQHIPLVTITAPIRVQALADIAWLSVALDHAIQVQHSYNHKLHKDMPEFHLTTDTIADYPAWLSSAYKGIVKTEYGFVDEKVVKLRALQKRKGFDDTAIEPDQPQDNALFICSRKNHITLSTWILDHIIASPLSYSDSDYTHLKECLLENRKLTRGRLGFLINLVKRTVPECTYKDSVGKQHIIELLQKRKESAPKASPKEAKELEQDSQKRLLKAIDAPTSSDSSKTTAPKPVDASALKGKLFAGLSKIKV